MLKKTAYISFILLIGLLKPVFAQDQKIGFIDSDIIMQNMPEYSGIEQRLSLLADTWQREIGDLETELAEIEADFQTREILLTDEVRSQRVNEINARRTQIEQLIEQRFGPEGDYFTRQRELLEPIQRQIFDALNRVATRDGFDFVFDRAQDTKFLFVRQQWNLTDEVMLEMGVDLTGN